ncbi:MAG: hypothetical protein ABEI39_04965 [Halobacteriales archaeon]
MDRERIAAGTGIVACLLLVGLAALPYAFGRPSVIRPYYAGAIGGPPLVALFGAVEAIVLLAALRRRSDPAALAGAAVVLGTFGAILAWWWALGTTPALVGGFTRIDAFRFHPWAVGLAALGAALAAGWYARIVAAPDQAERPL